MVSGAASRFPSPKIPVREQTAVKADEYQVVRYHPEHRARLVELQRGLWSPYRRLNSDYLDWKHLRNPYTKEPLIYLAMLGDQVVGMRGFFGAKWQVGSPPQVFYAPGAGDLVIAPEHRNRGLVAQIMSSALRDLAARGYAYSVSLSAGSLTLLSQIATGWRSIGALQVMERSPPAGHTASAMRALVRRTAAAVTIHRRLSNASRRVRGWLPGVPSAGHFSVFDEWRGRRPPTMPSAIALSNSVLPGEMAVLVARLGSDGRICHVQDEEYFRWRFQNPLSLYRFLYWQESRLEGFLVLRASALPWRSEIGICAWAGTSPQVRSGLLAAATTCIGPQTLRIWSATLGETERTTLLSAGFRPAAQGITSNPRMALIRPVRDEMLGEEWLADGRQVLDLRNWNLQMICSDGT
jgi:GNAT superfamily N-acetyltransferase